MLKKKQIRGKNCPKQMLNIVGEKTLLRQTIKGFNRFINPFHLKPLGNDVNKIRFIIEPTCKNTAPPVVLAAITPNKLSSGPVSVVVPSGHIIRGTKTFQNRLQLAIEALKEGYLVTFGMITTRPETVMDISVQGNPLETPPMRISVWKDFLKNLI